MASTTTMAIAPLTKTIAQTTHSRREDVENALLRNGVIVPDGATEAQVNNIVITAIAESNGFRKDFAKILSDDSSNMAGYSYFTFDQEAGTSPIPAGTDNFSTPNDGPSGNIDYIQYLELLAKFGSNWWKNRQERKLAEEMAEEERKRLERFEEERRQGESSGGVNWVAIGVITGVVALLGTTIFLVTRKK